MGHCKTSVFLATVALAMQLALCQNQIEPRSTLTDITRLCYMNADSFNRYNMQPMHIENLISIIRKIEQRTNNMWDMRKIAKMIINRYQFDGISFNPDAVQDSQFSQSSDEGFKNDLLKRFLPSSDDLDEGVLDIVEKCALHWMMSHALNVTLREDEIPGQYTGSNNHPYNTNNNNNNNNNYPYNSQYNSQYNNNNNNNPFNNGYSNSRMKRNADDDDEPSLSHEDASENDTIEFESSSNGTQQTDLESKIPNSESNETTDQESSEIPPMKETPKSPSHEHSQENDGDELSKSKESTKDTVVFNGRSVPLQQQLPSDADVQGDSSNKFARQSLVPKTRSPVETGVVYTKWGAIAPARVIAGIAAGLEPMTMTGGSNVPVLQPDGYGTGSGTGFNGGGYGSGGYGGVGGGGGGGVGGGYGGSEFGGGGYNSNNRPGSAYGSQYPGSSNSREPYNPPLGQQYQPSRGGRNRRQIGPIVTQPLDNLFAVTLSGDIGQAAVLNAFSKNLASESPPTGSFNNTMCPRLYILNALRDQSQEYSPTSAWTAMTGAEIRGGIDGLILGTKIRQWHNSDLRLSDILSMYYSEEGVIGDPTYRSCNRPGLYSQLNIATIREQSKSFAWKYGNMTGKIRDIDNKPNVFNERVEAAFAKMSGFAGSLGQEDSHCARQSVQSNQVDDGQKYVPPKTTLWAVVDYSATQAEIEQQLKFLGQVVHELEVGFRGSRVGLVDGSNGQILVNANFTDNPAILACDILNQRTTPRTMDYVRSFDGMRNEIQRLKEYEERNDYNGGEGNGITILFLNQGRQLDENQKNEIRQRVTQMERDFGYVHIMFASSKYTENFYQNVVLNPNLDTIFIRSGNQNLSEFADEFVSEYQKKNHGRLYYPRCNTFRHNQDDEHKRGVDMYLGPNTIQYYKIAADYFFSARNLRLRFTSDNGKARICTSQQERFPSSKNAGQNGVHCKETSGNYIQPGSGNVDVEFGFSKPCGKNGERNGCSHIYVSVTPTIFPPSGSGGLICKDNDCWTGDKVRVTMTHWDMRCNGGFKNFMSVPMSLFAVVVSFVMWSKTA